MENERTFHHSQLPRAPIARPCASFAATPDFWRADRSGLRRSTNCSPIFSRRIIPMGTGVVVRDRERGRDLRLFARLPQAAAATSFIRSGKTSRLFLKALSRYLRYNERSRRFIRWMLMHGWREVPAAPRRMPHFHINLLPDARKMSTTRALMSAYLSYLVSLRRETGLRPDRHVREPARRKDVRAIRIQGVEPGRDHEIQGVLSGIGLSQHRDQEFGNGRTVARDLAATALGETDSFPLKE